MLLDKTVVYYVSYLHCLTPSTVAKILSSRIFFFASTNQVNFFSNVECSLQQGLCKRSFLHAWKHCKATVITNTKSHLLATSDTFLSHFSIDIALVTSPEHSKECPCSEERQYGAVILAWAFHGLLIKRLGAFERTKQRNSQTH